MTMELQAAQIKLFSISDGYENNSTLKNFN